MKIQWSLICLWNFCVLARQAHVQLEKQNDVLHFHFVGIINIFASSSSSSPAGKQPRVRMRRWMDPTVRICVCACGVYVVVISVSVQHLYKIKSTTHIRVVHKLPFSTETHFAFERFSQNFAIRL